MLALERPRRLELARGVVDAHRARPAPGEPCRPVGGPAAELDHVLAGHVGQDREITLAKLPDTPGGLVARPGAPPRVRVLGGETVPGHAVAADVLGQGIPRQIANPSRPRRKSRSAALTSTGRSCWVQWPQPGRMRDWRSAGTASRSRGRSLRRRAMTGSRSPATKRAGTVTGAPCQAAISSQVRSRLRYQFNPPRKPVRVNSAV